MAACAHDLKQDCTQHERTQQRNGLHTASFNKDQPMTAAPCITQSCMDSHLTSCIHGRKPRLRSAPGHTAGFKKMVVLFLKGSVASTRPATISRWKGMELTMAMRGWRGSEASVACRASAGVTRDMRGPAMAARASDSASSSPSSGST